MKYDDSESSESSYDSSVGSTNSTTYNSTNSNSSSTSRNKSNSNRSLKRTQDSNNRQLSASRSPQKQQIDPNILSRWNCELVAVNKNDRKILVRAKWNDKDVCQIMRIASINNGFTRITIPFRSDVHAHHMALYCQRNNINFIVLGNLFYLEIGDYKTYRKVSRSLYNINNRDIKSQYVFRMYVDHENVYKQSIRNNTKYNSVVVYKSIESLKYKTISLVGSAIYSKDNIPSRRELLKMYNEMAEENKQYNMEIMGKEAEIEGRV